MAAAPEHHPRRSPPAAAIRVVDTALVHPSSPPSPPETALPLTFYDVLWLRAPPVQRVLFYRLEPDADVHAIVANLRDSLSQVITIFFPLAGRLRLSPGAAANRYELQYRPSDAVTFTFAESDDHEVDSLAADEPREVSKLAPLAPPLPSSGAVLALQATVLLQSTRRQGLALGVTVHHAACDGAASTHFLHSWAAAAANLSPPLPPVIDRTLVSDPTGLYDAFCPKSSPPPSTAEDASKTVDVSAAADDKLFATFVLSRACLQRVKDLVAAEAATRGVARPPRCSSLVAALGVAWSCHHRAKPSGGGHTCLVFPVDYRSRTQPPLPATYFGNCVGAAIALASKNDLASGLWSACAAVVASIEEAVTSGLGTETVGRWRERAVEAAKMSVLSVAGSPRFRVYELDFGFGRPAKVDVVSVARTGAIAVAESRDHGGGVEVGVCLPPDGMDAFRKCFDDAVAGLDLDDAPGAR